MVYVAADVAFFAGWEVIHDMLPCELFDIIMDAIIETSVVYPEFVTGNHFTENSKLSLAEFGFFFIFREGKTLQRDIENYMSNFKTDIEPVSKQYLSHVRNFIKSEYFKSINRKFLCNIGYLPNNNDFGTYKGFFLYGCDGSVRNYLIFCRYMKNSILKIH